MREENGGDDERHGGAPRRAVRRLRPPRLGVGTHTHGTTDKFERAPERPVRLFFFEDNLENGKPSQKSLIFGIALPMPPGMRRAVDNGRGVRRRHVGLDGVAVLALERRPLLLVERPLEEARKVVGVHPRVQKVGAGGVGAVDALPAVRGIPEQLDP